MKLAPSYGMMCRQAQRNPVGPVGWAGLKPLSSGLNLTGHHDPQRRQFVGSCKKSEIRVTSVTHQTAIASSFIFSFQLFQRVGSTACDGVEKCRASDVLSRALYPSCSRLTRRLTHTTRGGFRRAMHRGGCTLPRPSTDRSFCSRLGWSSVKLLVEDKIADTVPTEESSKPMVVSKLRQTTMVWKHSL